jgi:hypothetical protein
MAILYLKCAEIITGSECGIYELIYTRGDKRYKIFASENELCKFLEKNRDIRCENRNPVYENRETAKISPEQIKYLTQEEVEKYLSEMKRK